MVCYHLGFSNSEEQNTQCKDKTVVTSLKSKFGTNKVKATMRHTQKIKKKEEKNSACELKLYTQMHKVLDF